MIRNRLFLGLLAAAFALILGTTDAQARHRHSRSRNDGCCRNVSYRNCGYRVRHHRHRHHSRACCQQTAYYGGCQPATYAMSNTGCCPAPTCCTVQPACATVTPATYTAPQTPTEPETPPAPGKND
jgi:hypothetical protein